MKELATVKWFGGETRTEYRSYKNDYGFLRCMDGNDIYVNRADIIPGTRMQEGDVVTFVRGDSPKGPRAVSVQMLENDIDFFEEIKQRKQVPEFFASIHKLHQWAWVYYKLKLRRC